MHYAVAVSVIDATSYVREDVKHSMGRKSPTVRRDEFIERGSLDKRDQHCKLTALQQEAIIDSYDVIVRTELGYCVRLGLEAFLNI
jgi:hypothetical protein